MDESVKIKDWYFNELLIPKVIFTSCSYVVALICLLYANTLLYGFSMLHPLRFIYNSLSLFFDVWSLLLTVLISVACLPALLAAIYSLQCSQKQVVRIDGIGHVLYFFTHIFSDLLFTFCAVTNAKESIDYDQKFILLFFTLVLSVYYSVLYLIERDFWMRFPKYVVPMTRQLCYDFENIFVDICQNIYRIVGFACVAYAMIGWKLYAYAHITKPPAETAIIGNLMETFDEFSIWNMLNLHSIYLTTICTFVVYVKRKLGLKMIHLWFCRPYEFEMPSPDPYDPLNIQNDPFCPNLADVLSCKDPELLMYLAFWDLTRLTILSKPRLHKLFLVSKPGGHPRSWNTVSAQCISVLEEFSQNVQNLNTKLARHWESTFYQKEKIFDRSLLFQGQSQTGSITNGSTPSSEMPGKGKSGLNHSGVRILEQLIRETNLFRHVQLYLWIIESLGNILCAAYHDDKYGVVQKDLPNILGLLADLHTNLERFGRLSGTQYLGENKRKLINENRSAIKDRLAEALRQIKATYGESWIVIELTDEQRKTVSSVGMR